MRTSRMVLLLALVASALPACGRAETPPAAAGEQADPEPAPEGAPPSRSPGTPEGWPSVEARRLEPDYAPTPFTADQIRRGCPSGLRAVYRMGGDGATTYQHFAFDNSDGIGTDFSVTVTPEQDTPLAKPRPNRLEWSSLQRHAHYPERTTVIENETITVKAGTFRCMRYTVTSIDDGKAGVGSYWFAYDLPGPPIKWVQRVDDVVVRSMELIQREIVK